ncbi:hypothetical protein K3H45_03525 [Aeromonas veronii]|nr:MULTISPECIES: hypothetical protein [Aeromonas]MVG15846.1 hypothetical protein [Aeromonas jandaei]MCF5758966.1 hypothetical protein [Aeromonas veronii]MCF5900115.1 hypothetical protein [Aeromonas veronii]MDX7697007.1 hypothetical protein [Aeromonas dhakensis]QWL67550.1 hypothetical protein HQ398_16250 [Aeromonas jandaei]
MMDMFELEPPVDELDETESGPARLRAPEPVSQLAKHWKVASNEYLSQSGKGLLELGAVRCLYWLALGNGEVALGREIAEWWALHNPLHGLGETIR